MEEIKLTEFINCKIDHVLELSILGIPVELQINYFDNTNKASLVLSINDDGETVDFNRCDYWINASEFQDAQKTIRIINEPGEKLSAILHKNIERIQFGISNLTEENSLAICYYILISGDEYDFLFFNNGDFADYAFENVKNILGDDVYDWHWSATYPSRIISL